ncbi:MAG: hypothetical protein Q7S29_04545 [Candidatus Peribacter sp.]|nr:hypothetical protein [Candidatus Peribacter sp.]
MVAEGPESDAIDLKTLLTAEHPQVITDLVGLLDDHTEVVGLLRQACRLGNDVTSNLHAMPRDPANQTRECLSQQTDVVSQIIEALSTRASELANVC